MLPGKPPPAGKSAIPWKPTTEQAAISALLNRNLLVVSIQEKIGKKGQTAGGKVALAGPGHVHPPTGDHD